MKPRRLLPALLLAVALVSIAAPISQAARLPVSPAQIQPPVVSVCEPLAVTAATNAPDSFGFVSRVRVWAARIQWRVWL